MSDINHALKTPLTIIIGSAQVLQLILEERDVLTEEERQLLQSIMDQGFLLNTLLDVHIRSDNEPLIEHPSLQN